MQKKKGKFFSLTDTRFPILFVKKKRKKRMRMRSKILIRQIKVFNRQSVSTGKNLYVTTNKPVFGGSIVDEGRKMAAGKKIRLYFRYSLVKLGPS